MYLPIHSKDHTTGFHGLCQPVWLFILTFFFKYCARKTKGIRGFRSTTIIYACLCCCKLETCNCRQGLFFRRKSASCNLPKPPLLCYGAGRVGYNLNAQFCHAMGCNSLFSALPVSIYIILTLYCMPAVRQSCNNFFILFFHRTLERTRRMGYCYIYIIGCGRLS